MEEYFARLCLQSRVEQAAPQQVPLQVAVARAALGLGSLDDRLPAIDIHLCDAADDSAYAISLIYARQQLWKVVSAPGENPIATAPTGLLSRLKLSFYSGGVKPLLYKGALRLPGYTSSYARFELSAGVSARHHQLKLNSKKTREQILYADLGLLCGVCDWILQEVRPEVAEAISITMRHCGNMPEALSDIVTAYIDYPPARPPKTAASWTDSEQSTLASLSLGVKGS